MALVCDFTIIQTGQEKVNSAALEKSFNTDLNDPRGNQQAIFQFMYRGLIRSSGEVFVNDRKGVDLLPYTFARAGDWFGFSFVTNGVVRERNNVIRFAPSAELEQYWICNLICFYKHSV